MQTVTDIWNFCSRHNSRIGIIVVIILFIFVRQARISWPKYSWLVATITTLATLGLFLYGDGATGLALTFGGLLAYTNMSFDKSDPMLPKQNKQGKR